MQSNGRLAILIYTSAATMIGAAAMMAIVRGSAIDSPRKGTSTATSEGLPHVNRLAFVPPGALSLPASSAAEPPSGALDDLRSGTTELASRGSWSTETVRTEPPALPSSWRFSLFSSSPAPSATPSMPPQASRPVAPPRYYTVKTRLAEIAIPATARLAAKFEAAKAIWPPTEMALVAIKDEKVLEMHTRAGGSPWTLVHRYRVLAASGGVGPKLRQGDKQVPEGIYGISFLNPNSAYHVSLRVNYPNAFDRQMAAKDGRKELGGDIMIHGKNLSAGCLAMGDEAVEELFLLAAQTGLSNVKLIISPTDLRRNGMPAVEAAHPEWLPKLYAELATAMTEFKTAPPRSTGLLSFFMK